MAQSSYVPVNSQKARSKTAPACTNRSNVEASFKKSAKIIAANPPVSPGKKAEEGHQQLSAGPIGTSPECESTQKTTKKKKEIFTVDKSKKKKKKGYGKEETTSADTASVQQTSAQLNVEMENKMPLKMIDTIPNERTKIVMKRFIQATIAKGITGILQEFIDIKATSIPPTQLKKEAFDKNPDKNRYKGWFAF